MATRHAETGCCALCGRQRPRSELAALGAVSAPIAALARAERPDLGPALGDEALICAADRARLRRRQVERLLEAERGELGALERDVLARMEAEDIDRAYAVRLTFGERAADAMAAFGGSWGFILGFVTVLGLWIGVNVAAARSFDPYPFILLNLVLSCVAALQAPIIMMSQRRQEEKDRMRAQNDYKVNLKAELEIRRLHDKIDHQLARQWDRLAEIQRIQVEMLEEAARRR